MPEYPINIKTRETALTNATTNNQPSANKGATLTNAEVDQNFLNIKKSIDEISARYYVAHNTDGSIKTAYLQGDIHYVEDVSTTANQLQINSAGVITSLAAGITLFVKVNTLNTGASTIQITNTATNPDTVLGGGAKSILKNKDVALIGGELKEDEIVIMNYDGSNWQVVGESAGILDNQTVGSLITFDSTGKPVVVAPGTTGQVLTATTTSPPAFATPDNNIKTFDLGSVVVPNESIGVWKRVVHNLGTGVKPKHITMYLECINSGTSTHKWNAGDRIYYLSSDVGGNNYTQGPVVFADNVFVGVQINQSGHWELPVKYGGGTVPTDNSVLSGTFDSSTSEPNGMWDYSDYDQDFKIVIEVSI